MTTSKPIRTELRVVSGTPEVLEASFEDGCWRLRLVRNGREAHSTCVSKWQRIESAFQIFALETASDVLAYPLAAAHT
jgi:hypothetical protein